MTTPPLGVGRFDCPVCRARFAVLGDKKRHIREEHPRTTNEETR